MPLLVANPSRGRLLDRVRGMLDRSRDLATLAEKARQIALEANRNRAMRGVGFDGQPYAPLKPSTIAERKRLGYPIWPPLNRQGPNARVITGCVVQVTLEPGRLKMLKSWPGIPWMESHILGNNRLPRRDPAGWGQEERDRLRALLPNHVFTRQ